MSTPLFQDFNPYRIKWQGEANEAWENFDYSQGIFEMFFSGSIGSAKTIEHIHLITRHCLENPGARYLMLRRALKDLKRTSWNVLLRHMADIPHAIKSYNKSDFKITFKNGSEILGDSYDKGDLEKFRSLELSGADFEEVNECEKEVYDAVKMRVGRIPGVKQNIITSRCNPEGPSHWLHDYFIEKKAPLRKVFYSLTEQNPFLPRWYIENLKNDLDPKMARRMLYGEWVEIDKEVIYYNYKKEKSFLENTDYKIDTKFCIDLMHDFNIGKGKPMSAAIGQAIGRLRNVFAEFHVEGARTSDIMEEIADSGIFEINAKFRVFGDASGNDNDTRSIRSDYEIIKNFLSKYTRKDGSSLIFEMCVPPKNPPIRRRQNLMNALFGNANGETLFYIYKGCEWVDQGFRLTSPSKGSLILEDDSLPQQHVTTAIGYWCDYLNHKNQRSSSRSL